ncbi:MAG: thrombospondin type 3 repeat-containing protein [Verrucomicrobia bacterium]|nr:thrombospondin type 3 repeat-containing protein [Verrucomicrobiota bacterium]
MKQYGRGTRGVLLPLLIITVFLSARTSEAASVDLNQYQTLMSSKLTGIADLEDRFRDEQDTLIPVLPPGEGFILRQGIGARVLPFDMTDFPKEFNDGLVGEYKNSVLTYPVTVAEDQETRAALFVNSNEEVIYSLPASDDYDPYAYLFHLYPLIGTGTYPRWWISMQYALWDPSRIEVSITLVEEDDLELYLYAEAAAAQYAALSPSSGDGGYMMSTPSSNDLWLSIHGPVQDVWGVIDILAHIPIDFTNDLEMFSTTNVLTWSWELRATNLETVGTNVITWTDNDISNCVRRYYVAGNADRDADSDSLADAREIFLHRTSTNDWDTDDDGVSDGGEINDGTDPLNSDDPPNVSGFISYYGFQTGDVWVVAVVQSNAWATNYSSVSSGPGWYQITKLPPSNYWIKAFRDLDGDTVAESFEANGYYTNLVTITGQVTGISFEMSDPDSDGDSLPDWWEMRYGLDHELSNSVYADPDQDWLTLGEEYWWQANPMQTDSDGDGMPDGWEVAHCLNPVDASDGGADPDSDGVLSSNEYLAGTHPMAYTSRSAAIYLNGEFSDWVPSTNMVLTSKNIWSAYLYFEEYTTNEFAFEFHSLNFNNKEYTEAGWSPTSTNLLISGSTQELMYVSERPSTNQFFAEESGWYLIQLNEAISNSSVQSVSSVPEDFGDLCPTYRLASKLSIELGIYKYHYTNVFIPVSSGKYQVTAKVVTNFPTNPRYFSIVEEDEGKPWHVFWAETNQTDSLPDPLMTGTAEAWIPGVNNDDLVDIYVTRTNIHCLIEFDPSSGEYSVKFLEEAVDSDGDGLSDYFERFVSLTDVTLVDTDGDGIDDGLEVGSGSNPRSKLPASGINTNWLFHGNTEYWWPSAENLPHGSAAGFQKFLTGPRKGTNYIYLVAATNLVLGVDESAEVGAKVSYHNETLWLTGGHYLTAEIDSSGSFHGLPTLGVATVDVYRIPFSGSIITDDAEVVYWPYVRSIEGTDTVAEVFLYETNLVGAANSNNWIHYPQYFGTNATEAGFTFEPYEYPTGTNVIVLYNSSWTHDDNNDGTQDSQEVAEYYAARRSVPSNNVLGVSISFNSTGTQGRITCSNLYHEILTNLQVRIGCVSNEIYYIAVCYGVPVEVGPFSQSLPLNPDGIRCVDSFFFDLEQSIAFYSEAEATFTNISSDHSFRGSSSNTQDDRHLSQLRESSPDDYSIYLTGRIDGPTVEVAKGLIDKALYAERYLQQGGVGSGTSTVVADEWYAGDGNDYWKVMEVASNVKNLFLGEEMYSGLSPFSGENAPLSPWEVIHDNFGVGRNHALIGAPIDSSDNLAGITGSVPRLWGIIDSVLSTNAVRLSESSSGRDEWWSWSGYTNRPIFCADTAYTGTLQRAVTNSVLVLDSTSGLAAGDHLTAYMETVFPLTNILWHVSYYKPLTYYDVIRWDVGSISVHHESYSLESFRKEAPTRYGNRALVRGVTALAGAMQEPVYNAMINGDLMFSSLVQGYQLGEAMHQAYRQNGIQQHVNMVVGDPLYAPFRGLWEGTSDNDLTVPFLATVTNSISGCSEGEMRILGQLGGTSSDELADVAMMRVDYGEVETNLSQSTQYVIWDNPYDASFDRTRKYWYGRFLEEKITNLTSETVYYYQVWVKDPCGNETNSSVLSFTTN